MGKTANSDANQTAPLSESASFRRAKYLPYLALVALLVPTIIVAFILQSAIFQPYDDEGYLILSLKQFLKGKPLYDEVYTQYGPAYYLGGWLFYKILGLSVTNDTARILNILGWSFTTLVCSLVAYRLSRSFIAALLTHTLVFRVLSISCNEPGHPQVLCVLLLALAALCISFYAGERRQGYWLGAAGLLGGLLAATKLNLGAYFVIAGLLFIVNGTRLPDKPLFSLLRGLISGSALLFPVLLMAKSLSTLEIALYCGCLLTGLAGVILNARRIADTTLPVNHLGLTIGGFTLGMVAPCLLALAYGTSPSGLIYGLVLQHIGFDAVFPIPPFAFPLPVGIGIASAFAIGIWLWRSSRVPGGGETFPTITNLRRARIRNLIKVVLGASGFVLLFMDWDNLYPIIPLLWLVLLSGENAAGDSPQHLGRVFLACIAVVETLWVFPVAGTHVAMAAMLPGVIVALCLAEGLEALEVEWLRKIGKARNALWGIIAWGVLLFGYGFLFFRFGLNYGKKVPLGLPGASMVRVWPEERDAMVGAAAYLRDNADTFVMVPGMNSFYVWTGKEPPTSLNVGTWMTLLTDAQQNTVIQSIAGRKRILVLINPAVVKFWMGEQEITREPLMVYIQQNFRLVKQFGGYYILAPRENIEKSQNVP